MYRSLALALLIASSAGNHAGATEALVESRQTAEPSGSADIQNRELRVISFFDGRTLLTPKAGLDAKIELSDGQVRGSIGCGILIGGYDISGNRMRISTSQLLLHRCSFPGPHDGVITAALTGNRVIERDKDRIVLRDTQGAIQVVLAP